MKRYGHLFEQVVDMDNLKLALQKAKNGIKCALKRPGKS